MDFSVVFDVDGFGKSVFEFGINLLDYIVLQVVFEVEDKEVVFEDVVQDMFVFFGVCFYEEDKGGYDKLFGFVYVFGKEYLDQGWGVMFGNMELVQLWIYFGIMVWMGKFVVGQDFLLVVDWIEVYVSYFEFGGLFEFRFNLL